MSKLRQGTYCYSGSKKGHTVAQVKVILGPLVLYFYRGEVIAFDDTSSNGLGLCVSTNITGSPVRGRLLNSIDSRNNSSRPEVLGTSKRLEPDEFDLKLLELFRRYSLHE